MPCGGGARSRFGWRVYLLVALAAVNAVLLAFTLSAFIFADVGADWRIWAESGKRVFGADLYAWDVSYRGSFRYSPIVAYAFAVVAPVGYWGWAALHFLALVAIPRTIALLTLVSFPFWSDVYNGGVMTFVFVAAVAALRGSQVGTGAFLALTLLIPRPLMLPVTAWLLWRHPSWRWPFVGMFAAHALLVLASGWGEAWISHLLEVGGTEVGGPFDLGPARIIGPAWILLGLALAAWLTYRGRLGLASLAASPYWLGYYAIMLLLELPQARPRCVPPRRAPPRRDWRP